MRYIGLMSGTSMDGIDAVLVDCPGSKGQPLSVRQHHHLTMPAALRQSLVALNSPGANELHRAALAANELARCCAAAVHETLHLAGAQTSDVCAIGAHGQTVRHRPGEFDATGYTLQLLNGALLAELCGIDVVCDFRSRDLAAGGQGAPLVPAFHAALWGQDGMAQAVLNLGGIGNLSLLGADGTVGGFDCGPGNALMDLWCERHLGQPYDHDGAWAAGGHVIKPLLSILLSEPFFERIPPKSTGRDLFNADWLDRQLARAGRGGWGPQNIQATLAELTVITAAHALMRYAPDSQRLLVCGGGAFNGHLMRRLEAALPGLAAQSTDSLGLPALQVEAAAFAWLAHAHLQRQPGNRAEVTGALGPRVLGALYPAS